MRRSIMYAVRDGATWTLFSGNLAIIYKLPTLAAAKTAAEGYCERSGLRCDWKGAF